MKKVFAISLAVALLAGLMGAGITYADHIPGMKASKATAKVSELTLIDWVPSPPQDGDPYDNPGGGDNTTPPGTAGWTTILEQVIRVPQQKDLFIDVSLETGLYTRTHVKSKRNAEDDDSWDSSRAQAKIDVRVGINGNYASLAFNEYEPGVAFPRDVCFDMREQILSAKFMGIFNNECLSANLSTGAVTIDYECLEPEEIELILNTLSSHSFNFVVADLDSGDHTITVEARITGNGAATEGSFEAKALVGRGSVLIEQVRMIQNEDFLDLPES
jgi:hypothetical protein